MIPAERSLRVPRPVPRRDPSVVHTPMGREVPGQEVPGQVLATPLVVVSRVTDPGLVKVRAVRARNVGNRGDHVRPAPPAMGRDVERNGPMDGVRSAPGPWVAAERVNNLLD